MAPVDPGVRNASMRVLAVLSAKLFEVLGVRGQNMVVYGGK